MDPTFKKQKICNVFFIAIAQEEKKKKTISSSPLPFQKTLAAAEGFTEDPLSQSLSSLFPSLGVISLRKLSPLHVRPSTYKKPLWLFHKFLSLSLCTPQLGRKRANTQHKSSPIISTDNKGMCVCVCASLLFPGSPILFSNFFLF